MREMIMGEVAGRGKEGARLWWWPWETDDLRSDVGRWWVDWWSRNPLFALVPAVPANRTGVQGLDGPWGYSALMALDSEGLPAARLRMAVRLAAHRAQHGE